MASNNVNSMEHIISCSICLENFNDPRILPCSHTYCFECIQQIASSNNDLFECPLRDGTKIRKEQIDSLPLNRAVRDMIEHLRSQNTNNAARGNDDSSMTAGTPNPKYDYLQNGIRCAEQAVKEDEAHNYKAAAQYYMTAAEWLMHGVKYVANKPEMKQKIRSKIDSYIERAEEIKQILKDTGIKSKTSADRVYNLSNASDSGADDSNGSQSTSLDSTYIHNVRTVARENEDSAMITGTPSICHDYVRKGIRCAEQAVKEDEAHNYKAAAQYYMTAAEWLMHGVKYVANNPEMKQMIRSKIESYIERAEEIKQH